MRTVGQLLTSKPEPVFTVAPDATILQALEALAKHDIGALPVVEGDSLRGIFSERDYARGVALRGRSSRDTPVRDLMVTDIVTVTRADTLLHCMDMMTTRRVRHLPVLDDGGLIGIVTIGDVVKQVLADQTQEIEQLESYIQGH
jgi:CBS domain-containing protein